MTDVRHLTAHSWRACGAAEMSPNENLDINQRHLIIHGDDRRVVTLVAFSPSSDVCFSALLRKMTAFYFQRRQRFESSKLL